MESGLGSRSSEVHRKRNFLKILDFAIRSFKTEDIFGKRLHEAFGMLWSKYDPRLNFAFGSSGHNIHKINHKFRVGMGYDSQIGVFPLSYFFTDFDIQLISGLIWHR